MVILGYSNYQASFVFRNPHLNTIYPALFRNINNLNYKRERLYTSDGDFIDLDFSKVNSSKIAIISHGLESNSYESYMKGTIKALNQKGWDAVAFNFRGCSGEANNLLKSYHSGATEDLREVIQYICSKKGGNLVLKYLGEGGNSISSAVTISVPCCLKEVSIKLAKSSNSIYMKCFLYSLKKKIKAKAQSFPDQINYKSFANIKTFYEFDNLYTAPFHGFKDAEDYWAQCSSLNFIPQIKIPTLLINALDDPFLGPNCYPFSYAEKSDCLFLETPKYGGHVGFASLNEQYWHEKRIIDFIEFQR
jgi:uncharacterized protein